VFGKERQQVVEERDTGINAVLSGAVDIEVKVNIRLFSFPPDDGLSILQR